MVTRIALSLLSMSHYNLATTSKTTEIDRRRAPFQTLHHTSIEYHCLRSSLNCSFSAACQSHHPLKLHSIIKLYSVFILRSRVWKWSDGLCQHVSVPWVKAVSIVRIVDEQEFPDRPALIYAQESGAPSTAVTLHQQVSNRIPALIHVQEKSLSKQKWNRLQLKSPNRSTHPFLNLIKGQ